MDENTKEIIYYVNPYGERINFSLQGKYSVFRNNIVTPGATRFNKEDFCQDILKLFAANRVVSLGLVVADTNKDDLQTFTNTKTQCAIKEITGFGLDEQRSSIVPFHLRGIKSDIPLEQLQTFLLKHSFFSLNKPIKTLQFTDNPNKIKGNSDDKYFSEFIIATKLSNHLSFVSSFFSNAKDIDLLTLINDFAPLSTGKIASITRLLSLHNVTTTIDKDLNKITPYGVTGRGENEKPEGLTWGMPFILEWIDGSKVWNGVQAFIKKYMRIRSSSETIEVKDAKISKNYPIKIKETSPTLSKRGFANTMRNNPTQAEEALGYLLGTLKLGFHDRFKRQITIAGFIADFYSAGFRLAIEVDGKSHLSQQAKETDKQKDIAFFRHQVMILRISNEDALYYPDTVKPLIQKAMKKWRSTAIEANPWDLSDEDITNRIKCFREILNRDTD